MFFYAGQAGQAGHSYLHTPLPPLFWRIFYGAIIVPTHNQIKPLFTLLACVFVGWGYKRKDTRTRTTTQCLVLKDFSHGSFTQGSFLHLFIHKVWLKISTGYTTTITSANNNHFTTIFIVIWEIAWLNRKLTANFYLSKWRTCLKLTLTTNYRANPCSTTLL